MTDPLDMWLCMDGDYVRPATSQESAFVRVLKGPITTEDGKTTAAVASSETSDPAKRPHDASSYTGADWQGEGPEPPDA